ncbi:Wzz/FepE/Etk N-terminal domain-containing protein [Dysgonomonas macrotermitis]|uniref:Chain length determinant protein n=1 Tax=Dysgonomonas macrotermitis TaxID=1346286 RepID=A0A1M5I3A4_9BACT|nr:Wzz/FepE/Etk N-terminal domain-containing protein [Dysgonomonas macrotermitis]SHG22607.1 Chain length determinant protein [Dysgonomonas macrotermitis]
MATEIDKNTTEEKEIDLIELGQKLWSKRKFILKISAIGFVLGIIVAFSIPKEYTTIVILAPESSSGSSLGGASALAAMAGINLDGSSNSGDLSSDIYPNIMGSTPFVLGLSSVNVRDKKAGIDTTLYMYIKDEQKESWWVYILGLPRLALNVFSSRDTGSENIERNSLFLTKDEVSVIENIRTRISVSVDKKTSVITLSSTMQSPEISAFIADTLTSYLQSYIIKYRTEKARADLVFAEKLYNESKDDYTKAQQKYADYLDKNQNVILASYRVNQEKLQNEASLAYNVYNQVAQQLQVAKVKVQDQTPVYTVIQPAVIPLIPAKPNKKLIVIGFIFLFGIGACGWILGKDLLKNLRS